MRRELPFTIDRGSPVCFAEQVVDGLKTAICAGRYREGDRLPSWCELAEALGVSQRVPREAMARLVSEGWVVSRPRLGSVVSAGIVQRKAWKGTVLIVHSKSVSESYSSFRMCNALERTLVRAGFAVVRTTVDHKDGKHTPYDLTMAEKLLSFKIDFVVIESTSLQFQRWMDTHHVPYLCSNVGRGCAAWDQSVLGDHLRLDFSKAIADFVKHCQRADVKRVLQVSFVIPELFDAVPALLAAGIKGERRSVPCERDATPNQVTAAGLRTFSKLLRKNRDWLPDVLLITDDYLAIGVFMALTHAGVRIPEELKVVTFANAGNEPVLPVPPAYIVADCAEHGEAIARIVLGAVGRRVRRSAGCYPKYVPGGTFPAC